MDFYQELRTKYPWLSDSEVGTIVDKAKMFFFLLKYPCEPSFDISAPPIDGYFNQMWVMSACDELVERLGFNSAIGYRENGVNWSFDGAYLSERLVSLIRPKVGVIK